MLKNVHIQAIGLSRKIKHLLLIRSLHFKFKLSREQLYVRKALKNRNLKKVKKKNFQKKPN